MRIVSTAYNWAIDSTHCYLINMNGSSMEGTINFRTSPSNGSSMIFANLDQTEKVYKEILEAEAAGQKLFYVPDLIRSNTIRPIPKNENSVFSLKVKI